MGSAMNKEGQEGMEGMEGMEDDELKRIEVGDDTLADFNAFRDALGLPPVEGIRRGRGRKKLRSFTVTDDAYEGLKVVAGMMGAKFGGRGGIGGRTSVSELLEMIGTFKVRVHHE